MRIKRSWTLGAALVLSAAGLMWAVPVTDSHAAKPAAAKPGGVAGTVTFLKGGAQAGPSEKGPFKPLRRSDSVREGDFIKTAADGRLELKLADASLVRLNKNSTFKLGLAKQNAEKEGEKAQSKLTAGKMWAKVTKAVGSESKFAVRTENAVAGVRGTTFRVNAEEDGATLVKVYEGAVAVTNAPIIERAAAAAATPGEQKGGRFAGRKEVAAPFKEVSKEEWEKIVGKMMQIRVAADGAVAEPEEFKAEADAATEDEKDWVAFNTERDAAADAETAPQ